MPVTEARKTINVLMVEDSHGDVRLAREMLSDVDSADFTVTHVVRVREAIKQLSNTEFDAVLLDIMLPDSNSVDSVSKIQEVAPHVPIIVLSSIKDEILAMDAVQRGAQDYIVKWPNDAQRLVRTIHYSIERKRSEERLAHLVNHDSLTGVFNRTYFREMLPRAIKRSHRTQRPFALVFLDLDRFKAVNDTFGHATGDALLQMVTHRLEGCLRKSDLISRLGGDEFTLILEDLTCKEDAQGIAAKILSVLSKPYDVLGNSVQVSASLGVVVYDGSLENADTLTQQADMAMYIAKERGANSYHIFSQGTEAHIQYRQSREEMIRDSLANGEFSLYYQPKVHVASGQITGVEALVRWKDASNNPIMEPAEFLPIAESTGLIIEMGRFVLETACKQNLAWQKLGAPPVRVCVNLSNLQFHHAELEQLVKGTLEASGLPPAYLELETTDNIFKDNNASDRALLLRLRELGVRLCLDNFGSGFASLNHLKELPFDSVKIDSSFIHDICNSEADGAIVQAIVNMAHSVRLNVIGEGVETQEQFTVLRDLGCDEVQGFLIGYPMSATDITPVLLGGSMMA